MSDRLLRGGRVAVDPLQEAERGAADRAARRAGLRERLGVESLRACMIARESDDLREAGKRVFSFGEPERFLGGGRGFVERPAAARVVAWTATASGSPGNASR